MPLSTVLKCVECSPTENVARGSPDSRLLRPKGWGTFICNVSQSFLMITSSHMDDHLEKPTDNYRILGKFTIDGSNGPTIGLLKVNK